MMPFDMKTSIFTYIFVNYIYSMVLGVVWYRNRARRWGIGFFFADFVLKAVGMTLACLRNVLPHAVSIVAANALMFSGTVFMLFGMARFFRVRLRAMPYVLYTLIFTSLYAVFALVHPDIRMRIILFSGMLAPVVSYSAWIVFSCPDTLLKKQGGAPGVAFALFAIVLAARVAFAVTGDPIASYFNQPIMDSFLTLLCQILSVFLAYSLLLMISHRHTHLPERPPTPAREG